MRPPEAGVTFGAAEKNDAREIARLFQIASGGVVDYVWSTLAPQYPGLTPLEIGTRRYAAEDTPFSYRNCTIAGYASRVAGMVLAYTMGEKAEVPDEPADPVLKPYGRLEISGSFYIAALAVFPEFRGQGLGTKLLTLAGDQARAEGCDVLSLIVFEQNEGAVRLYGRNGFEVVERAPVVPHPLIHYTGDALLMAAPI
jgi:ribosomal protein S18 acetylase RimI-like enzyme